MTWSEGDGRRWPVDGEPRRWRGAPHGEGVEKDGEAQRGLGKVDGVLAMLLVQGIDSRFTEEAMAVQAALLAGDEEEESIQRLLWIKEETE